MCLFGREDASQGFHALPHSPPELHSGRKSCHFLGPVWGAREALRDVSKWGGGSDPQGPKRVGGNCGQLALQSLASFGNDVGSDSLKARPHDL